MSVPNGNPNPETENTSVPERSHTIIPWRGGNEVFQKLIDGLPRIKVSPNDECPICLQAYTKPNDEMDTAVKLGCGHIMGSSCLLKWISGNIFADCPLCRDSVVDEMILAARAQDMKRYLFWLLRSQDAEIAMDLLYSLELYKTEYLQLYLKKAMRRECMDLATDYHKIIASWQLSRQKRRSLEYANDFMARVGCRAARKGKPVMEWLLTSMRRAAASWILHHINNKGLILFTNFHAYPMDVEQYTLDEKYGPNGSEEDYTNLPDIALTHVKGSGVICWFDSEFPVLDGMEAWVSVIDGYLDAHPMQRRAV